MKARKQGKTLILPVPAKFDIKLGQEFIAVKGELGSITYIPKTENIFKQAAEAEESLRYKDGFAIDDTSVGREEI